MKIDMHVHLVGTGAGVGGSGCWYRPKGYTALGAPFMLRGMGLRGGDLDADDFDRLYVEQLRRFVRGAGLDAILLLAQELPHDAAGRPLEERASFYVPNRYVLDLAAAHPEFLAGVSIHPARPDALEELERCLAAGAAALKCLPNVQGIDWNDRRYTSFLERMAAARTIVWRVGALEGYISESARPGMLALLRVLRCDAPTAAALAAAAPDTITVRPLARTAPSRP